MRRSLPLSYQRLTNQSGNKSILSSMAYVKDLRRDIVRFFLSRSQTDYCDEHAFDCLGKRAWRGCLWGSDGGSVEGYWGQSPYPQSPEPRFRITFSACQGVISLDWRALRIIRIGSSVSLSLSFGQSVMPFSVSHPLTSSGPNSADGGWRTTGQPLSTQSESVIGEQLSLRQMSRASILPASSKYRLGRLPDTVTEASHDLLRLVGGNSPIVHLSEDDSNRSLQ